MDSSSSQQIMLNQKIAHNFSELINPECIPELIWNIILRSMVIIIGWKIRILEG